MGSEAAPLIRLPVHPVQMFWPDDKKWYLIQIDSVDTGSRKSRCVPSCDPRGPHRANAPTIFTCSVGVAQWLPRCPADHRTAGNAALCTSHSTIARIYSQRNDEPSPALTRRSAWPLEALVAPGADGCTCSRAQGAVHLWGDRNPGSGGNHSRQTDVIASHAMTPAPRSAAHAGAWPSAPLAGEMTN